MRSLLLSGALAVVSVSGSTAQAALMSALFEVQASFSQTNEFLFRSGLGTGVEILSDEFDHIAVDSEGKIHQVSVAARTVGGAVPFAEVQGSTIQADGQGRAHIVYLVGVERQGLFFPPNLPVPVRITTSGAVHALYASAPAGQGRAGASASLVVRRGPDSFGAILLRVNATIFATGTDPEVRGDFSDTFIREIAAGTVVRVDMNASGGVSGDVPGFKFARSGEFEAFIDPIFEIDPAATFLFGGVQTRFADAYTLQFSEGIEPFQPPRAAVPEPGTLTLFCLGGLGLIRWRGRRCGTPRSWLRMVGGLGLVLLLAPAASSIACGGQVRLVTHAAAGAQYGADIQGPFVSEGGFFTEETAFAFPFPQPVPLSDFAFAHGAASLAERSVHSLTRAQGVRGGIPLRAFALGRTTGVFFVTSPSAFPNPVDLDLHVNFDGILDVGNVFDPIPGQLTASVEARLSVRHISPIQETIRELTPFLATASLDGTTTVPSDAPLPATLTTSGGWSPADFPRGVSQYDGTARTLDLNLTLEDALSVTIGDFIQVEIELQTEVFAIGAFATGARADFFRSGSFELSSSTPGVTFQLVPLAASVPEPGSLTLLGLGGVLAGYRFRRGRAKRIWIPLLVIALAGIAASPQACDAAILHRVELRIGDSSSDKGAITGFPGDEPDAILNELSDFRPAFNRTGFPGGQLTGAIGDRGAFGLDFLAFGEFTGRELLNPSVSAAVTIASADFQNELNKPVHVVSRVIVDGGSLQMLGAANVKLSYQLRLGLLQGGIPNDATGNPDFEKALSQGNAYTAGGTLIADENGDLEFTSFGGGLNASFNPLSSRVIIPLSLQNIDLGLLGPGEGGWIAYHFLLKAETRQPGVDGFAPWSDIPEGIFAHYSDPLSLSDHPAFTIEFQPLTSAVPEPSSVAIAGGALLATCLFRRTRRTGSAAGILARRGWRRFRGGPAI